MIKTLSALTFMLVSAHAISGEYTYNDVLKLRNDKEVMITSFNKRDRDKIVDKFNNQDQRDKIKKVFFTTIQEFLNEEESQKCELHLIDLLRKNFKANGLPDDKDSIEEQLKMVRVYNGIDDILYDILSANNKDYFALQGLNLSKRPSKLVRNHKELLQHNDIKDLYSNFEEFPDEINNCAYQEFVFIKNKIRNKDNLKPSKPLKEMSILNIKAYEEKLITVETYNKLEYLREKSDLTKRMVWLKDYIKIIFQAKNQMLPLTRYYQPINLEDEDRFSSERVSRWNKLTRRKLLYKKYDETQIILLAQVIQKASRRMGVDVDTQSGVPYISQEFSVLQPNGTRQTYVERHDLDPQSQFNLARRLMRKDILDLQMMDIFNGLKITYQDVVMAAFETGYISIEDITYVIRYDDLWNPERSKYERVMGFVFRVAGYSTFFLPPPWNVIGTIAIGIVEGIVEKRTSTGAENDNPATFIE